MRVQSPPRSRSRCISPSPIFSLIHPVTLKRSELYVAPASARRPRRKLGSRRKLGEELATDPSEGKGRRKPRRPPAHAERSSRRKQRQSRSFTRSSSEPRREGKLPGEPVHAGGSLRREDFTLSEEEPRAMSKLQDEVDSVLGDRFPTIEDVKKLKYTTRVINESLRLYPQPPVLIRRSIEDDVLGKYPINRGEDIFISLWNLHRCPKYWVDPESFNPERWPLNGPNPNETNQNFSYLPFGGGPRKCVGDMFATFETVVATAMLVRRFNFQIAITAPPVEMTTGATIHTTEGLVMTVTRRTRPPIIPSLEAKQVLMVGGDQSQNCPSSALTSGSSIPEADQQGEVTTSQI